MTWDRVERLIGTSNLKKLADSRVTVVGLGSGGGLVALNLAMSGVGHFTLVDDDVLEQTNLVRHVADARYLGWNKAEAVADLIRHRNPNAQVEVVAGKIETHLQALDNADVLVVGVDGEQVKYTLNAACLERGLTAVYAGVYERGEGGDVVVIHPGDGPCYACWAAELRDAIFEPIHSENLDYGMIGESGTLEAEPALWVQVMKVAAVQTDFVLNELLKDSRPAYPTNTLIIANAEMEILADEMTPPHTSLWVNIARDPHCLVCGDEVNHEQEDHADMLSLTDLAGSVGITIEGQKDGDDA